MSVRLRSLARNLFRRRRVEADLDEELSASLEILAAENAAAGMDPAEARRQAAIALGGVEQVKEAVRASRTGAGLGTLAQDVRYALRMLAKSPAFATAAIATLALGIGANTAIFTVLEATLLAPLPYAEPSRLVMLWTEFREGGLPRVPASPHELLEIRRRSRQLAEVAGVWVGAGPLTGEGEPERVRIAQSTANFLPIFGVPPALGRTLVPSDEGSSAAPVIVLSDAFWRRRFGADTSVLGRGVRLDGRLATVVGVLAPGFDVVFAGDSSVPPGIEVFTTFSDDLAEYPRDLGFVRMLGRLAPGATPASAEAELSGIAEGLRAEFLEYRKPGLALHAVPLHADAVRDVRPALLALFGGVALVVLIACANVANLLLARAARREKEIGLRAALGASRGRIARQLVTESLVLSALGGVLGLVLGRAALAALLALRPASLARLAPTGLSAGVLGLTLALVVLTGLACGLAPAVAASRRDLARALQEGGRGSATDGGRTRPQRTLVFAEVALGFVLLTGAGLLIRTFTALAGADPGFTPGGALTFQVSLPGSRYPDDASRRRLARELAARLEEVPGVETVGAASHLPFDDYPNWYEYYWRDGAPEAEKTAAMADHRAILPGFFDGIGARIVQGRAFTPFDDAAHPNVVVVDESLARTAWPGESPLGKRVVATFIHEGSFDPTPAEVVGVVRHVRYHDLGSDGRAQIYVPYFQSSRPELAFTLRTRGDPAALAGPARAAVAALDADLAVSKVRPLEDYVRRAKTAARFTTVVAAALAGLALVLAAIGIYGLLAYGVAQRSNEIGIRVALGGRPRDILWLVLRQAAILVGAGLAAGLVASFAMTRLLSGLLVGVGPRDGATLAGAAAVIAAAALLAAFLPARRAVRVDPAVALRGDR
jgi:putative ABC transport system permease protein